MPVRRTFTALASAAAVVAALGATPAFAEGGDYAPQALPPIPDEAAPVAGYSIEERDAWLAECRARMGSDDGVGGAVIGGLIGGVAGNRIAGRGNRVVGTVVGAGVGAVAGAAIDKAEDRGRAADFCEDYLDRYESGYSAQTYAYGDGYGRPAQGYGAPYYPGPGYGYSGRVMWVPMVISSGCKPQCDCRKERIVEEWVEQPTPAKRVVPTKYVKTQPTKYVKTKPAPTKYAK